MEQETLFTASKWEILKLLERGALSPIELASLSRTSVANVSQQLRLLEMARLVKSERVPNRDKGQPRVLYSLADDSCYLIATAPSFVEKRQHGLSVHNKIILRIWFLGDREAQYFLEKGFWQIEHLLSKLSALAVSTKGSAITFHLLTEQLLPELQPYTVTDANGVSRTIKYVAAAPDKVPHDSHILFDPSNHFGGKK